MTKIVKRSVSARCVFAAQFAQLSASALLTEWIWMRKWRPFSNLEMWITGTIQSINSGRISICKYRKVQEFYETLRWSDEESSDLSEEEDLSFMLPTLWTMALTFLWIASSALIVYIKCSILWRGEPGGETGACHLPPLVRRREKPVVVVTTSLTALQISLLGTRGTWWPRWRSSSLAFPVLATTAVGGRSSRTAINRWWRWGTRIRAR